MNDYEERKQARIDRYRERAEKARQRSGQLSHESISMLEHMLGLPDGWTKYGADGEEIRPAQRYRALGNAVALPCADYIMAGVAEALADPGG